METEYNGPVSIRLLARLGVVAIFFPIEVDRR